MPRPRMRTACSRFVAGGLLTVALAAQERPAPDQAAQPPTIETEAEPWSLHGQVTTVIQGHGAFPSPYAGANSLESRKETRTSFTTTLFLGRRLWKGAEFYLNPEAAAGQGISQVMGLAGAPNGKTYRVGSSKLKVALARLFLRQTWGLGGGSEAVAPDANQLGGSRQTRRIVMTLGRFSAGDIFDQNAYAHDPRSQFLNWALMDTATWDYPADTRGYTWGAALEVYGDAWALRAGSFLEPKEANGLLFDHHVARAHGDVLEVEHGHELGGLAGRIRVLGYANHARMGDYRESLAASPARPDVTTTRREGRLKYGWGLSAEQALTADLGAFLRAGWNDGRTETWAFTEVDRTVAGGVSLAGPRWGRPADRLGLAAIVNDLAPDHRAYLAAGGYGFIVGDGRLDPGQERILEAYYALEAHPGITVSLDAQRVQDPAFNRDRGPISIFAVRVHGQF